VPLAVGLLALAVGTAFGWQTGVVDALVAPPPIVRAALVGASAVAAGWLLIAAFRRLAADEPPAPAVGGRDFARMVRGIRFVFLAIAALSAGAGWILGHPLPIVVALVIAGVDVVETSFLLLVVRRGR
jgi:hypothetical protein